MSLQGWSDGITPFGVQKPPLVDEPPPPSEKNFAKGQRVQIRLDAFAGKEAAYVRPARKNMSVVTVVLLSRAIEVRVPTYKLAEIAAVAYACGDFGQDHAQPCLAAVRSTSQVKFSSSATVLHASGEPLRMTRLWPGVYSRQRRDSVATTLRE
jgi:hypothetical protein